MNVTINGALTYLNEGAVVSEAVTAAGHEGASFGVAIALNGEVVARSEWQRTTLIEGDRIEILIAAQGG